MNAHDKAEALRLVDELFACITRDDLCGCLGYGEQLRSLLSAQVESEPSAEQWRQAIREEVSEVVVNSAELLSIEQRARELARKGVGK